MYSGLIDGLLHETEVPAFYRHLLSEKLPHEASSYRRSARYNASDGGESLERLQTLIIATTTKCLSVCTSSAGSRSAPALRSPPRTLIRPALETNPHSNLKQLTLTLSSSAVSDRRERLFPLRRALKLCKELETLAISVKSGHCYHPHRASCLAALLSHGRPLLPKLHTLSMNGLTVLQNDLLQFLAAHATTLRDLRISDMTLTSPRNDNGRPACWVATIKQVKTKLELDRIAFQGWFCNGAKQLWYISPNESQNPRRLLPAVRKYVTDPSISTCPLEQAAVAAYNEDESTAEGHRRFEGDWTWTITRDYERRRYGLDGFFSGPDLFGDADPPETELRPRDSTEVSATSVSSPSQDPTIMPPEQHSYADWHSVKKAKISHESHHDLIKSSDVSWGGSQIFGFTPFPTNLPLSHTEDVPMAGGIVEAGGPQLTDYQYVPLQHALPLSSNPGTSIYPSGTLPFGAGNEADSLPSLMSFLSDDAQNDLLSFDSGFDLDTDLWQ
jgi:hypothetical protein